jgi:MFS family permease
MNERRGTPWLMASMASLVVLALYVTIFTVPPVISTLVHDLDITHEEAGLLMTVYLVVYCLGSLVAGFLSDRFGAKPVMASGLLLASIAGYFFASNVSYPLMLLSRVIIGWGAAFVYAPGLKFVLAWLPADRATTGVAWYSMALAVGSGIPMLLTPILMVSYG